MGMPLIGFRPTGDLTIRRKSSWVLTRCFDDPAASPHARIPHTPACPHVHMPACPHRSRVLTHASARTRIRTLVRILLNRINIYRFIRLKKVMSLPKWIKDKKAVTNMECEVGDSFKYTSHVLCIRWRKR